MARVITQQLVISFSRAVSDTATTTDVVNDPRINDLVAMIAEDFETENIVVELVKDD